MAYATDGKVAAQPDQAGEAYRSIVSDLTALIGHVQASLRLIESAMAREKLLAEQDAVANVIVLDDVPPRYMEASAALKACDAGLLVALRLIDSEPPARRLN
jgi:hypothetical protein